MLVIGSFSFMKIIHIKLPYKGGKVIVLKESGQYGLRKLVLLLHNKGLTIWGPCYY